MDTPPFRKPPYKGLLAVVAVELGFKGRRRTLYKAIRQSRNLQAMLAVAKAIGAIEADMQKVVNDLGR